MDQIEVKLANGKLVMCRIIGDGRHTLLVEFEGRRFAAERALGAWRELPEGRVPVARLRELLST